MLLSSTFILVILSTIAYSFPCPPQCICKPTDTNDVDFTRMSYLIDCTNVLFKNDKLVYQAEEWSINVDTMNSNDDDRTNDYAISIDLSNSLSLKKFTNQTIEFSGFTFVLRNLSLANQGKKFLLTPNSFGSSIYENLQLLNLSSCCQQIPKGCQEIFRPLSKLRVLDLSGSEMYKTCLNTPDTVSPTLHDLVLRNNNYDTNTFSHSSRLFDGVRAIPGKLDLQNSRFQMGSQVEGNCLFDLFQQITALDLSGVRFESISDAVEIHLAHLLKCKTDNGKQLMDLYLRRLQLQNLPEWFTHERFPDLHRLDLSQNNFRTIDFKTFLHLRHISLAYNPIDFKSITWRNEHIYKSINLRSTMQNRSLNISRILTNLFKLTKTIDYSDNEGETSSNMTNIPIGIDVGTNKISLNISRTNIYSFQIDSTDLQQLDISWNILEELDLSQQVKLNYVDCSNQYLQKLILNQDLSEFTELRCSNNSLKTIENFPLMNTEKLKLIDLSYNAIDILKNLFSNLTSRDLRTINLQANQIQIIRSFTFHEKLISLFEINLSWNRINKIEKFAFQSPNLQILDLTGNPLKRVEPKAIFTASLRFFSISNNSQELIDRCLQPKSSNNILFIYINWFVQNGTMMKNKPMKWSKCLKDYITKNKMDLIIQKGKHFFSFYTLYIVLGASLIGIFFGGIYCYRKNKLTFVLPFQRYKKLDGQSLVENAAEMDQYQREEDEIVMNLEEPPFNKGTPAAPTRV